ncbi:Cell cycle checkpoint protein RAD17 [Wallemia ichthyophaga EXF-994]|uniref:Cell cycle checkpoint protein RAD17 n=1 Tax=Wallemia ichthyophaga (strain EXF-994 / CBS 113033) TaxID=1299270 RepID=R9AD47_WALI9|nr:Cell cycle checkpoint protein RAD17 [Wallemia ichthyophaga EXF-994]EOR00073.1 Cell cycle checkpoint protein RAD17 [Wallemia ichthyophaga EXF-994]
MPPRTRASSKRTGSTASSSSLGGTRPLSFGGENNASITSFLKPQTANSSRSLSVKSTMVDEEFGGGGGSGGSGGGSGNGSRSGSISGSHTHASLWSDAYAPTSLDQLAVHTRKVADIRRWLAEATSDTRTSKYRKVLVLTGTAGCGKSTTVKLLAQDMGLGVEEYLNSSTYRFPGDEYGCGVAPSKHFATYLGKAATYRPLSFNSTSRKSHPSHQLILVEDLPNVLETHTREATHQALRTHCLAAQTRNTPLVIIVSDTGTRGTGGSADDVGPSLGTPKQVIDARLVVPTDILDGPYCQTVHFNPLARTFLTKSLSALLERHARCTQVGADSTTRYQRPHDEALHLVVESSNGDIRSAVNTLQMLSQCALPGGGGSKGVSGNKSEGKRRRKNHVSMSMSDGTRSEMHASLSTLARRETSLNLFHSLAKVLRNKRHGFDDGLSEYECECEHMPATLPIPLHMHNRSKPRSHVNPTALYQDIPVDVDTFLLFLAHNYPAYCADCDQAENVAEALSAADSMGSHSFSSSLSNNTSSSNSSSLALSNTFEYAVRATLDTLPTPSLKRSQKMRKPAHFLARQVHRERAERVRDVARQSVTLAGQADLHAVEVDVLPMLKQIWPVTSVEPSLNSWLAYGDKRFDSLTADILGENEYETDLDLEEDNAHTLRQPHTNTATQSDKWLSLKDALGAVDLVEHDNVYDVDEEIEQFSDI